MVGDLYSQIGRTLSTNWNLKFQRGGKSRRDGLRDDCAGVDSPGTLALSLVTQDCDPTGSPIAWPGKWNRNRLLRCSVY